MKSVRFRDDLFCRHVASKVRKWGDFSRIIRKTGVTCGTLNRAINDHRLRDFETIMSLAEYLEIDMAQYIETSTSRRADYINV